ncbi:hypothetical protein GN241_11010 [Rhodobacteraceae bacterium IMCC1335]
MRMLPECFDLAAYNHPFKNDGALLGPMPEGVTIAEIVRGAEIDPRFLMDVQVTVSRGLNSSVVPMSDWHKVRPRAGAHVLVTPRVQGPAAALLLGALLPSAAGYVAGTLFGFAATSLGYALTYAAVTIVGALLINALIPPPSTPNAAKQDDPNFSITGSGNAENRYGVYPTVLGRHLIYPPKTARGYTEGEGDNIHFRGRYTFGYGPVALETLNIGTTPITEFEGVEIEFLNVDQTETLAHMPELADLVTAWRTGDAALSLYPDDIAEDTYSVKLTQDTAVVRATRDRAVSVSVDVTYQGLVKFDGSNAKQDHSVEVKYRYRKVGAVDWIDASTETHTGRSTASLRYTKTIALPDEGEYDIEVTRLSADSDETTVRDDAFLSAIRSVQAGALPSHSDIAEIAVRIKASDQLNGQIETLNAVAHQMAPVWDGASWSAPQPVRHPAWIYARALMGPMLSKPIEDLRIQLDDLRDWAQQEPHWTCDAVIDQSTTVAEVLDLICATGRARRTLRDLKYSVIRDGGVGPIVQQFSPRNSWGFTGSIQFPKVIHGFRVRCLSERLEWQQDEITVYADGYDATTATEFETLELRGVVLAKAEATGGNAWRLGRYHLAQAILRPEEFSWQCDLDHLRVNMGDKVRLIHDVPLIGVGAGRITQFETNGDGTLAAFVLDELMTLAGSDYRICLRLQGGDDMVFRSAPPTSYDGRWTVSDVVEGYDLRVGDLVSVEEMTQEGMEVLIKSITHQGDMKATLTGVPAAPAVLLADQGYIPEYVPLLTKITPRESLDPVAPRIIGTDITVRADPARVVAEVEIAPEDRFLVASNLTVLRDKSGNEIERFEFTGTVAEVVLTEVGTYALSIYAKDRQGRLSAPAVETIYRSAALTVPSAVEGFAINVVEQQAFLTWTALLEVLVSHYHVRFLADGLDGGWDRAVDVETQVRGGSLVAPALKGRYLIKAVSIFGQASVDARVVESDIDPLAYYNAVLLVSEGPDYTGSKGAGLVADVVSLKLPESGLQGGAEADYAFAQEVDLGEVYTSRLTFTLQAYGYRSDNLIGNWSSLASVQSLSGVDADSNLAWVEISVRTTSDDPASPSAVWSDWKPLRIGEYVARGYQFKLRLVSTDPNVGVRVDRADVQIDMPDRNLSARDVNCPSGGVSISFDPPFKEIPAIFVNGQGLPTGAVSVQSAVTRSGFHQKFTDKDGNDIAASFDWQAVGFGRMG